MLLETLEVKMVENIIDAFEERARRGDGAFAIAYAILELADAQKDVATKLNDLVTVLNPVVVSPLVVSVEGK